MNTISLFEKIKKLISKDRLDEALRELIVHFDDEQVLLQSARLQSLKREVLLGTISFEEIQTEKNKVRQSILSLAKELKDNYSERDKSRIISKLEYLIIALKNKKNRLLFFLFISILLFGDSIKKAMVLLALVLLSIAGAKYYISHQAENRDNDLAQLSNFPVSTTIDSIAVLNDLINNLTQRLSRCDSLSKIGGGLPSNTISDGFRQRIESIADDLERRADAIESIISRISGLFNRKDKEDLERQVEELNRLAGQLRATLQYNERQK